MSWCGATPESRGSVVAGKQCLSSEAVAPWNTEVGKKEGGNGDAYQVVAGGSAEVWAAARQLPVTTPPLSFWAGGESGGYPCTGEETAFLRHKKGKNRNLFLRQLSAQGGGSGCLPCPPLPLHPLPPSECEGV